MTTILNASTSAGLIITPDTSGNIQLQYNGQSAPAFSVYKSSTQTISHNVDTKITFDTEDFDTNNNFANSTFTPTVAGYYQINWITTFYATTSRNYAFSTYLFKNGTQYTNFNNVVFFNNQTNGWCMSQSAIVYCNGSTDYLEIYCYAYDYTAGASSSIRGAAAPNRFTYFSGCLLRGA